MEKLKSILLYCGLDKATYYSILPDIDKDNRKGLCFYSLLIGIVTFALFILTQVSPKAVIAGNSMYYLASSLALFALTAINYFVFKKTSLVLHISEYVFLSILLSLGILLALTTGVHDVSATFIVAIFAIPVFFVIRPLGLILLVLPFITFYSVFIYRFQPIALFTKNFTNAIAFGIIGIVLGINIIRKQANSFNSNYKMNKALRTDKLSGLLNRQAFMEKIEEYKKKEIEADTACISFDLNGLKRLNDTNGHFAGDTLLMAASTALDDTFGNIGDVYRVGGDEFVAIVHHPKKSIRPLITQLNKKLGQFMEKAGYSFSVGLVHRDDYPDATFEEMLAEADRLMYKDKDAYYKRTNAERREN